MSVESKGLHAQNCVCRNFACLCTVIDAAVNQCLKLIHAIDDDIKALVLIYMCETPELMEKSSLMNSAE